MPFVVVPAKGKLEFKPGGYHVMLIGLKETLSEGKTFTLILHFKRAGKVVVKNVKVLISPPGE